MAFKNKIDPDEARERLMEWLPTQIPDAGDVSVSGVVIPSSSGLSCETVLFDAEWRTGGEMQQRRLVARVAPHPDDTSMMLFPSYDLELETSIMRALEHHSNAPTPTVLFHEQDLSVLGGEFLVMERIDGRVPPDDPPYTVEGWVLELDPGEQRKIVDNTVTALAAIHAPDWQDDLGLAALDRRDRGAPGIDQYIGEIEHLYSTGSQGRAHPTLEAGTAWAKEHRPPEEGGMVLNWGDARIGNVMFGDDLSVVGVLDWEMACIASREQDLGYVLFNLDFFTVGLGAPSPPGFPDQAEVIARYEADSGHAVKNIDYFKALAGLMAATILMRVAYVMIAAELLPADSPMPNNNPASQVMASLMGLPAPSGDLTDWTGVR